jgi:hypothetical protein
VVLIQRTICSKAPCCRSLFSAVRALKQNLNLKTVERQRVRGFYWQPKHPSTAHRERIHWEKTENGGDSFARRIRRASHGGDQGRSPDIHETPLKETAACQSTRPWESSRLQTIRGLQSIKPERIGRLGCCELGEIPGQLRRNHSCCSYFCWWWSDQFLL